MSSETTTKKTSEKSLQDKAVKIQGKSYVLVADRIVYFNETYPKGQITTELITSPESEKIVVKATVTPDIGVNRFFTGFSQAVVGQGYINRTSALENAETSAVGRALAMMGIGVIESVASVDEIHKAKQAESVPPKQYAGSISRPAPAHTTVMQNPKQDLPF